MSTIPASQIVNVSPSVLGAGGDGVNIIGLALTTSPRAPIGSILSFPNGAAVSSYFGPSSVESMVANGGPDLGTGYFGGFTNSTKQPGALLFAQYNQADVGAYLRGGALGLTLAQVQALSGSLNINIDGTPLNAPSVNLAGSTSLTSAAGIIAAALVAAAPSGASVTASIGGVGTASAGATFTGTGSGTNLTAASVAGFLHIGATVTGVGVPDGTYIVSQTSGSTGGNGVYVTNHATTANAASLAATSNLLDVTAMASGTLQPTDAISGSGVAAGTTITAQISGSPGGIGVYVLSSAQQIASTAITSLSTTLVVSAVASGTIEVGALIAGTNVTANSVVTALGTGTGGTGTYTLSKPSTTVSETMTTAMVAPTVSYDSVSAAFVVASGITGVDSTIAFATGTLAAPLKLTSSTGAVLSAGADAAVPAAFMDAVVVANPNWATFFTAFDPDNGSGNAVKLAFAAWKNTQDNRYAYVCGDLDVTPTASLPATSSLGYLLEQNGDSGTALLNGDPAAGWDETFAIALAAFVSGVAASIDFTQTRGRITFASKSQEGMLATVTTPGVASNLGGNPQVNGDRGNGYNFYGAYGNANANFVWFQRNFVTGDYAWLDSYINQIWLNNALQNALLVLMQNSLSIPYSTDGNALIESALADPIQAGLNFGAFGPGTLSSTQIAQVNAKAGAKIASTLQTQGYYLQIKPAPATTRSGRTSPPAKFWYIDQGSVQAINLSSVALS